VQLETWRTTKIRRDVIVRDEGQGIDAELHDVVFERFRPVSDGHVLSAARAGLGLGLAIVATIALHGGTLVSVVKRRTQARARASRVSLPLAEIS